LRIMRGMCSVAEIEPFLVQRIEHSTLEALLQAALHKPPYIRRRALAVLYRRCGISFVAIMRFLLVGRNTIKRCCHNFKVGGLELLLAPTRRRAVRKAEDPLYREMIISILHAPPADYGFNRTAWTLKLLKTALLQKGYTIGRGNLGRAIKLAGYKIWKAKEVLTSNDPEYQQKVEAIKQILATLGPDERFFSIDEFGPFAVKERGGRRFVKADEFPTVPQFQKSKGSLIMTGALELSTNQMTHFYSSRKDSNEMLKVMDLLVHQYSGCKTLYLSWDDASLVQSGARRGFQDQHLKR
jgi:transposase